jgi:hypothetical protein
MGATGPTVTGLGRIAAILQVSRTRVRAQIRSGKIAAQRNENGEYVASRAEVEALATARGRRTARRESPELTPEMLVRAYDLFEVGASMTVLVRELQLMPDQIRRIYAEWRAGPGGPVVLPRVTRAKGEDGVALGLASVARAESGTSPAPHAPIVAEALAAVGAKTQSKRRRKP